MKNKMKETIKETIKEKLTNLLSNIPSLFEADELAYLTLQQKNERQIRDKVAWRLQKELDERFSDENGPQLIVRCEWPSKVDSQNLNNNGQLSGRSAVDLAVLLMNDKKTDYEEVLALVEFKAHSFLNKEKWLYTAFVQDVSKMIKLTGLSRSDVKKNKERIQNADLYFVLVLSSHDKSNFNKYASAVVYKDLLDKGEASKNRPILYNPTDSKGYLDNREIFAKDFMQLPDPNHQDWLETEKKSSLEKIQYDPKTAIQMKLTNVLSAGCSFEYEIFVSSIIWGPYNYDEKSNSLHVSQ